MNTINTDTKIDDKQKALAAMIGCISILEKIVDKSELLALLPEPERIALITAAGKISRPDRKEIKKRNKDKKRQHRMAIVEKERGLRAATGIRRAREAAVFIAPRQISSAGREVERKDPVNTLETPRNCYVCKAEFTQLHQFYDTMCPKCAEFNYQKRFQTASLKNQVALITGSRLKIGYQATLMMLRAGAKVIATTRFPKDSALRFCKELDYPDWGHRLHIFGLDLRHTPSVEILPIISGRPTSAWTSSSTTQPRRSAGHPDFMPISWKMKHGKWHNCQWMPRAFWGSTNPAFPGWHTGRQKMWAVKRPCP